MKYFEILPCFYYYSPLFFPFPSCFLPFSSFLSLFPLIFFSPILPWQNIYPCPRQIICQHQFDMVYYCTSRKKSWGWVGYICIGKYIPQKRPYVHTYYIGADLQKPGLQTFISIHFVNFCKLSSSKMHYFHKTRFNN